MFQKYCNKINNYSKGSLVFLVSNPVSKIMQKIKNPRPNTISIIGVGVTNDTYRLQNNFEKKFDFIDERLLMIGDHLTNQEMTISQIDKKIAKILKKEEDDFFKNNKIENIYEYIGEKNYELLKRKNADKMFEFVCSLPLKYQGVARQSFILFLTKTILSTSESIDHVFNSLNKNNVVCCETFTNNYLGLEKSILGIPIKIQNLKPIPVELNYYEKEFTVLEKCLEIYSVK